MVYLENLTEERFVLSWHDAQDPEVRETAAGTKRTFTRVPKERLRLILGNKDDRGRKLPAFTADGLPIPGKTTDIEDGTPRKPDEWKGVLPSPIARMSNALYAELTEGAQGEFLAGLVKAGKVQIRKGGGE